MSRIERAARRRKEWICFLLWETAWGVHLKVTSYSSWNNPDVRSHNVHFWTWEIFTPLVGDGYVPHTGELCVRRHPDQQGTVIILKHFLIDLTEYINTVIDTSWQKILAPSTLHHTFLILVAMTFIWAKSFQLRLRNNIIPSAPLQNNDKAYRCN